MNKFFYPSSEAKTFCKYVVSVPLLEREVFNNQARKMLF
jgi:hypothetical protein